ncbi:RNA polymerase sigma-70 factor [Paraflavitalea speifideaquila]|uniref:RNA polymerase sigma-70 factor n=1 Tax=Paraflavitalea speifideaquila TaxID=3076558 RepID=UPI0028E6AB3C|nr:RNA polymerase sigma-70 factor [Paraflavitalea speifideiaquila]
MFKHFYPELYYFARKLTGSKEQAEDIVIDVFTKLFERHELFDTYANIKAFLYISTRNSSLNYLKHIAWQKKWQKEFAEIIQEDEGLRFYYEIESDLLEAVHKAIDELPDTCRRIFKMLYFEDLKPAEIAKLLNISVDTVYSQKRRALQILQLMLSDSYFVIFLILCCTISI